MSIRLTKPWLDLDGLDRASLPAQLGVFQLADEQRRVVYIGYGGGNRPFGLRTAVEEEAERLGPTARFVRYELTHGYLSRCEELLMVHHHDTGGHPIGNEQATLPRGRLHPAGGTETEYGQ